MYKLKIVIIIFIFLFNVNANELKKIIFESKGKYKVKKNDIAHPFLKKIRCSKAYFIRFTLLV